MITPLCRSLVRIALPMLLLASPPCRAQNPVQTQTGLPQPDHIVIVIEENHGFKQILGPGGGKAAPYMNQLAEQGALLTNYYSLHHPSQPNYIVIFSGHENHVTEDSCLPKRLSAPSLGGSLLAANLTFTGYAEDLPSPLQCEIGFFARRHCPWTDFRDVPANLSVPFSQFPTDFTQLPTVSFVIPNLNHDMHDGTIKQADAWLRKNLDAYIQWAKSHNSLFILTWDENQWEGSEPVNTKPPQNQIGTVLVGAMVTPGSTNDTTYNPHDLLRTIEDMYGLPLIGLTPGASDIVGIWQAPSTGGA
ncbi:MAG TPA: alkaline phosphatase family protein [Thermoanaerobaculia bacterium]|jgi:acid phosphatase|nr:alkaline phosphatase family protein [Thermoanaerobaculia bacterium]